MQSENQGNTWANKYNLVSFAVCYISHEDSKKPLFFLAALKAIYESRNTRKIPYLLYRHSACML